MHRRQVSQLLASSFALYSLLLGPMGCEAPPVELEPTPAPAAVSTGDYRLTELNLEPGGEGLDLSGDGADDNNFPYLLDAFYVDMQTVVVGALTPQVGEAQASQIWGMISAGLTRAGLPISSAAYNQVENDAVRTTGINYLPNLSDNAGAVSVVFYSGVPTPAGYQHNQGAIGTLNGQGVPDVRIDTGSLILLYPQPWFNLPLEQAQAEFHWSDAALADGRLGGVISIQVLVDAVLSQVPSSIEINGQTIQIPKEAIAKELIDLLEASSTPSGAPLFDQTALSGKSAISAGFTFTGGIVQITPG